MDSVDLLERAGWYPGRQVDTSASVSSLLREGYALHSTAITVLAEFSGLIINGPEYFIEGRNGRLRRRRQLWVDGERAAMDSEDPGGCRDYSEAVGDTLVPVGGEGQMTVLVGEQGAIWGAFSLTDSGIGGFKR